MGDKINAIISSVGALIIIALVFLLFRRFGLTKAKPSEIDVIHVDSYKDVLNAEKFLKETEFLSPNYWQKKTQIALPTNVLKDYAARLNDAFGGWWVGGDDEPEIYAVFEALKNGVELSQVADQYQKMFKESLRGKLFAKLDEYELHQIYLIIKNYKNV